MTISPAVADPLLWPLRVPPSRSFRVLRVPTGTSPPAPFRGDRDGPMPLGSVRDDEFEQHRGLLAWRVDLEVDPPLTGHRGKT